MASPRMCRPSLRYAGVIFIRKGPYLPTPVPARRDSGVLPHARSNCSRTGRFKSWRGPESAHAALAAQTCRPDPHDLRDHWPGPGPALGPRAPNGTLI